MSQAYALAFLGAVCLDIGAHWAQMYASLLAKAASHKDVSQTSSTLLRAYYGNRIFMGSLCVGAEVFYMCLVLLRAPAYQSWPATGVALPAAALAAAPAPLAALLPAGELSAAALLALVATPFWALKQATNVLQGQFAAQRLIAADAKKSS
jgi:CDP-diacylglycerol--inositol 3-phosphatidyltransferase